jgi:hypothetical protein
LNDLLRVPPKVAALTLALTTAALSNDCPRYSSADAYGPAEFYSLTKFGTIGLNFENDEASLPRNRIYVPTGCVSVPRGSTLSIYFNSRKSQENSVAYVSFKLYAVRYGADAAQDVLKVTRMGSWTRGGMRMVPEPWEPKPAFGRVSEYENFYVGEPTTLTKFDKAFGRLHGVPTGGQYSSGDDIKNMQPLDHPRRGKTIYLMHSLQRVAVAVGETSIPSTPPRIISDKATQADELIVSVFSPLNESVQSTLRITMN